MMAVYISCCYGMNWLWRLSCTKRNDSIRGSESTVRTGAFIVPRDILGSTTDVNVWPLDTGEYIGRDSSTQPCIGRYSAPLRTPLSTRTVGLLGAVESSDLLHLTCPSLHWP